MSKVAVVGMGYVGLPLAVQAAESGHDVLAVDVDIRKIEALNNGESYVEDISDERLRKVLEAGNFTATFGVDSFDIGIIAVPTPLKDRAPDLSYVEAAARSLGKKLKPDNVVVLESTTYPGTTQGLVARVIREESGLVPGDYHLGFSPERIDPGNPNNDFHNTAKIVSGVGDEALGVIDDFYSSVVMNTVPVSSPAVAEMAKIIENTFRHVNIALVNELAQVSHKLGVNVWEALEAADTKPYGFMKFTPGPGVGGHCIPIDPQYLTWSARTHGGLSFRLGELAQDINDSMPSYVVERAQKILNNLGKPVRAARILIAGVAYKPDIGDLRESPAIPIVQHLQALGADVSITDPHVEDWAGTPVVSVDDLRYPSLATFDLVIVVTAHSVFDFDRIGRVSQAVLDCRNVVPSSSSAQVHVL